MMKIYRITLARYATGLFAPGTAARWNSQGRYVIYTAGSVALACLENLVHRDATILQAPYKVMIIEVPESVSISNYDEKLLTSDDWINDIPFTRAVGDTWLHRQETCILKVPSAIIRQEFNYLINPAHPQFDHIQLSGVEDFRFDRRLKP